MSLDVYLTDNEREETCTCAECENVHKCMKRDEVYWANITHNLNMMAREAGIYEILWRPGENGITHARQLIEPLRRAIADMKTKPTHYKTFDAANGWGTYDVFVPWLERYLEACEKNPNAKVEVSR